MFSKTGPTLAVLSIDGQEPDEKERLNKSANQKYVFFFISNNERTSSCLMLREDMMLAILSLSVDWINIELLC